MADVNRPKSPPQRGLGAAVGTFRVPYYGRFWSNNFLQFMTFQAQQVAKQWLVTELTGSRTLLGLVGFIQGFSGLVVSPFAGAMSDRVPKRNLLLGARAVFGLILLVVAILVWTGTIQVWHVVVSSILLGSVQAVQQPASQTFVFDIVGRNRIQSAMAMNSAGQGMAQMLGPAIGGVVIGAIGVGGAYGVALTGVVVGLMVLSSIPVLGKPAAQKNLSLLRDVREGFTYIWRYKPLRFTMVGVMTAFFNGALMAMRPVFARDVLHVGSVGFGTMAAFQGVGTIAGATIIAVVLPPITRPGIAVPLAMLLYGTVVFMYSFAFSYPYVLAMEFMAGVAGQMYQVSSLAGLQPAVPDEYRGRVVSAVFMTIQLSAMGQLGIGVLADLFGDQMSVRIYGLCAMTMMVCLLAFGWRVLWQFRRLDTPSATGPTQP